MAPWPWAGAERGKAHGSSRRESAPLSRDLRRRLLFGVIVAAIVAGTVEGASFAFFRLAADRFALVRPQQYVLGADTIAKLGWAYDVELGWRRRYETLYGERSRPRDYWRPLATAFGDSFTHGDEVGDADTWPQALADRLQADVYNFGVPGFGADQALLRFRQVAARVPARLALLAFELRNIDRVVNRYRPFLLPGTGIPLPKPRFVLRDGALELLPNPVRSPEQLAQLGDPAFIESLGREDYWYEVLRGPRLSFPYSRLLFSPSIWRRALADKSLRGEVAPRPEEDLWAVEEPRALYLAILDAFAAEASRLGRKPVLVLLPGFQAIHQLRRGRPVTGRDVVRAHCAARGYTCFDALQPLIEDPEERRLGAFFEPGGHTSPLANGLIAGALAEFLDRHGLVALGRR